MRFLIFNIAVIAALAVLFERAGGSISLPESGTSAAFTVVEAGRDLIGAGERYVDADVPVARYEPEEPVVAVAPTTPTVPETPDVIEQADALLPVTDPAVIRRRAEVLAGIKGFGEPEWPPAPRPPSDVEPIAGAATEPAISAHDRARMLDDLARDMELMYASKVSR